MNKSYKYTILTLLLAVIFVFGSMEGMNLILRAREIQFLSESGRVVVEAPVRAWMEQNGGAEGEDGDNLQEGYVLTMAQIESAIESWNSRTNVILHAPVEGQISMEAAIEAGKSWLVAMDIGSEEDLESFYINAELGVSEQENGNGERLEAYYSFWTVKYSNQSMDAILYVNAVTGKVWGAEITKYEDYYEIFGDERLKLFIELAGLQISDNDSVVIDSGGTRTRIAIRDSSLYAQEQIYYMLKAFEDTSRYINYQLISE